MRKRLAIIGHGEEGLALIPLLEANPDVEVCAILTQDREATLEGLRQVQAGLDQRFAARVTDRIEDVLQTEGLVAIVDADPASSMEEVLSEAPARGIQVTTPLIAKLLYAFGPVDATRKPDLLQTLGEILESYNFTVDRSGLLNRVLQIAVGATGADRGSLMLIDPSDDCLTVDVAIGIEKELIDKIRIRPGEGIAGRALQDRRAILLKGKADRQRYNIVRERDDVVSAISAPLIYGDQVIGVLNLSHTREHGVFTNDDLDFVQQLAHIDAKIIARAEEYHSLLRDSVRLRAQTQIRSLLSEAQPLQRRLSAVCAHIASEIKNGVCHIFVHDPDLDVLILHASSSAVDPLASPIRLRLDEGVHGWVARSREPVVLSRKLHRTQFCFAVLPLVMQGDFLGLLSFEGTNGTEHPEILREKITAFSQALSEELHDALRELRMERETTQTAAINEFISRLRDCAESAEIHRLVTSSAAMILESEHAVLRLQDPDSGRFRIRSYFGSADTDAQAQLFAVEKELSIEAIKDRRMLRIVDLESRTDLDEYRSEIRNALLQPLRRQERVVGTLSVLGKVVQDPLGGESFSKEDQTSLSHLAQHMLQALDQVEEQERARRLQRFDEATGLPNAAQLRERIEQEIARCSSRGRQLALIRVQIEGLATLIAQSQEEGERVLLSIAQELRGALREFDVIARTALDTFDILVPEPDAEIPALLGPLARRAREAIRREPDPTLSDRLRLAFGYALFPDEAQTANALLERAQNTRISSD
ncbi:MAG: GAF domain-containing protein [Myxococcales bacterium]|nr:GAF domain-containing protein [Myxococcales bacterium]TDI99992.1 MAG: GAF domain-containing protein [Deltaproteobacteria bacterium]